MAYRRSPRLPDSLGFGGRMPPAVGLLIVLMVGATVVAALTQRIGLARYDGGAILAGQAWRLFTWVLVQGDPLALIFGGFILYQTGSQLAVEWGEGRFLARFAALTVVPAVIGTLLSLVWGPAGFPHLGMWPVVMALMFYWALTNAGAQVQLMFVLPVTGQTLALLILFGTVLAGLFAGGLAGLGAYILHFMALGLAWTYTRRTVLPTRRWRMQIEDWRREREFKRRSKHLKVVKKNGSTDEPPKWMN